MIHEIQFTSLIVQIKQGLTLLNRLMHMHVYIPHSSDKTCGNSNIISWWFSVYIPHSSDKTIVMQAYNAAQKKVYIPHSSDKTRR